MAIQNLNYLFQISLPKFNESLSSYPRSSFYEPALHHSCELRPILPIRVHQPVLLSGNKKAIRGISWVELLPSLIDW